MNYRIGITLITLPVAFFLMAMGFLYENFYIFLAGFTVMSLLPKQWFDIHKEDEVIELFKDEDEEFRELASEASAIFEVKDDTTKSKKKFSISDDDQAVA